MMVALTNGIDKILIKLKFKISSASFEPHGKNAGCLSGASSLEVFVSLEGRVLHLQN